MTDAPKTSEQSFMELGESINALGWELAKSLKLREVCDFILKLLRYVEALYD